MVSYLPRFIFKDWLGIFLIPAFFLIPLGWVLVPFAMISRYEAAAKPTHPTYQKHWKYIRLPNWAWIWETNSGLMGDGTYIDTYIWHPTTRRGQYYWTAWRNPIRGWKFRVAGIDLDGMQRIQHWGAYEVDDVSGKFGCQFVVTSTSDRTVTGLYGVWRITGHVSDHPWFSWLNYRCLRLRIGFKVKPSYYKMTRRVGGTPISLSLKRYTPSAG